MRSGITAVLCLMSLTACGAPSHSTDNTGTATAYFTISGIVYGGTSPGLTLRLTGAASATATTDDSGAYSFPSLANGDYVVTPSQPGFAFTPASQAVTVSGADVERVTFSGERTYTISGVVSGTGLQRAEVWLVRGYDIVAKTSADASGNYVFTGLTNEFYVIRPILAGFTFTRMDSSVVVSFADVAGQDFVATALPAPALVAVWGSSPGDVWAVGKDTTRYDDPRPLGVILRFDGAAWRAGCPRRGTAG